VHESQAIHTPPAFDKPVELHALAITGIFFKGRQTRFMTTSFLAVFLGILRQPDMGAAVIGVAGTTYWFFANENINQSCLVDINTQIFTLSRLNRCMIFIMDSS
jgi:hypothetical protein